MGPISSSAFATPENVVRVKDPLHTVAPLLVRIPWELFRCSFQGGCWHEKALPPLPSPTAPPAPGKNFLRREPKDHAEVVPHMTG